MKAEAEEIDRLLKIITKNIAVDLSVENPKIIVGEDIILTPEGRNLLSRAAPLEQEEFKMMKNIRPDRAPIDELVRQYHGFDEAA